MANIPCSAPDCGQTARKGVLLVTEESGEAGFITALPKFGMALCEAHAAQAQLEIVEADPAHLRLLTVDID